MDRRRAMAIAAVVAGATVFGMLGICTRYFQNDCGLTAMDTVLIRLVVSSSVLLLILAILARGSLRIQLRDVPIFLMFGLFKFLSDVTFFYSQGEISLCLSTLLQMTAPYYVMIISLFLFRDRITPKKMAAMVLGSMGCILVTGVLTGDMDADFKGIASAMLSGLFFGMFMIGSKFSSDRGIKPETSLFYTLLVADLIALPFSDIGGVAEAVGDVKGLALALALGVAMTLVPFYLYAWSVDYLEPTVTSMISVLEVVVAAVVGYLVFDENLGLLNVIGMLLVILSIIGMNIRIRIGYRRRFGKYIPPKAHPE